MIADLIEAMAAEGAPMSAIILAVRALEAKDAALEARRASDRARKQRQRDKSRDSHVTVTGQSVDPLPLKDAPAPSSETPVPRSKPHPTPYSPPPFVTFWLSYPNKVGKRAAETAYQRASKRADPQTILDGLERAKQCRAWSEGFIPHPTTWLNQDRWLDEPDESARAPPATAGMIAAASDELAFRLACQRVNERDEQDRDNLRNQGVVIPLPAPANVRH